MARAGGQPRHDPPPDWARAEAEDELYGTADQALITGRAAQIATEREGARHDEYDDPDQGGEG